MNLGLEANIQAWIPRKQRLKLVPFALILRHRNVLVVRKFTIVQRNTNEKYPQAVTWSKMIWLISRDGRNTKRCAKYIRWKHLLIRVSCIRKQQLLIIGMYCGLCGNQGPLKRTDCCNRTVCDMSENPFGDSGHILDNCSRNHRTYTLCGIHHGLHSQDTCNWRECVKCKDHLVEMEKYVGYGTSRYNFQGDWKDPPTFAPKNCAQCGRVLYMNIEGVIFQSDGKCICQKHNQVSPSVAKALLSSGAFKVESLGISWSR